MTKTRFVGLAAVVLLLTAVSLPVAASSGPATGPDRLGGPSLSGSDAVDTLQDDSFEQTDVRGTAAGEPGGWIATVQTSPHFVVTPDINSTVVEGETLSVTYTVENTGQNAGTKDVRVLLNGSTAATREYTLAGGETTSDTVTYETDNVDLPALAVTVETDDDSVTQVVDVLEVGELRIDSFDVNESAVQGTELTVDAGLHNTGETELTQQVSFAVVDVGPNETLKSEFRQTVVGPDSTTGVTFTYDVPDDRNSPVDVRVATDNDQQRQQVSIIGQADLRVTNITTDDSVVEGETIVANVALENRGEVETTQDVRFEVDTDPPSTAILADSVTKTVGSGESASATFSYTTERGDSPVVDVRVATADNTSAFRPVAVKQVANFSVSIETVDDEVDIGDDIDVDYQVTNVGDVSGTQDIVFRVEGEVNDTESVEVEAGNSTTGLSFNYTTTADDTPWVDMRVESDDDGVNLTVPVNEDEDGGDEDEQSETDDDSERQLDFDNAVTIQRAATNAIEQTTETASVRFDESAVKSITFDDPDITGRVRAFELDRVPASTGDPRGETVTVVLLLVPEAATDVSATIDTEVPLAGVDADPETLVMMRHANGEWQTLDTKPVVVSNTTATLQADTPGFSYFAVSAVGYPEARFDSSAETLSVAETLTVDAARSTYDSGEIGTYEWIAGGETYSGRTTEISFDEPGEYTVELTVTSEDGTTDTETMTVLIEGDAGTGETDGETDAQSGDDQQTDDGGADDDQSAEGETGKDMEDNETSDDGDGTGGIIGTVLGLLQIGLLYVAVPILVILLGLKGVAYYLGY